MCVCVCVCTWKGWEDKGVFVCISLCRAGDLSTVFTLDVKNQNQDICGLQKSMIQKENASHAVTLKKRLLLYLLCGQKATAAAITVYHRSSVLFAGSVFEHNNTAAKAM